MGKTIAIRSDWDEIKLEVMEHVIRKKFRTHPDLAKKLVELDEEIVEHNRWHDNFWGACTCNRCTYKASHNHLGRILMKIRKELRES